MFSWLWDIELPGVPDNIENALPSIFLAQSVATVIAILFFNWFLRRVMQPRLGDVAADAVLPGAASAAEVRGHAAVLARLEHRIGELEAYQRQTSALSPTQRGLYRATTPINTLPEGSVYTSSPSLRYSQ